MEDSWNHADGGAQSVLAARLQSRRHQHGGAAARLRGSFGPVGEADAAASSGHEPPHQRAVALRLWLIAAGVAAEELDYAAIGAALALLAEKRGTKTADLGGGWKLVRHYARLAIEKNTPVVSAGWQLEITAHRGVLKEKPTQPGHLPARATLNAAAVGAAPLLVRAARPGDRLAPLGMQGSKKLQDIFTDAKVPRERRGHIPVVECRGAIVWLPGYRVARGWEVPTPRSRSLFLTLSARP